MTGKCAAATWKKLSVVVGILALARVAAPICLSANSEAPTAGQHRASSQQPAARPLRRPQPAPQPARPEDDTTRCPQAKTSASIRLHLPVTCSGPHAYGVRLCLCHTLLYHVSRLLRMFAL